MPQHHLSADLFLEYANKTAKLKTHNIGLEEVLRNEVGVEEMVDHFDEPSDFRLIVSSSNSLWFPHLTGIKAPPFISAPHPLQTAINSTGLK